MDQYNDDIELKDILIKLSEYKAYLLKKKFIILSVSFLFLVIGLLTAYFSEEEYHAELTFVVEAKGGGAGSIGSISGIASQFGFDLGGSESATFSQQNIFELLKSRRVVVSTLLQDAIVNGKNDLLIEHYLEINKIKESWIENESLNDISFHNQLAYVHDSIIEGIWNNIIKELEIEFQSREVSIISLSYTSVNEEYAKRFVEILIEEMSKMYISHQTAQTNNTLDFLQNRADSVFNELEIAEEKFAKVKDINQRIIKASGRLKELQLMRNVEVLNTMYLEIIKNLELSKLTLLNQTPIINIIDTPILPLQDNQYSIFLLGVLGAFLGGFLIITFFILRKVFKDSLQV